MKKFLVCMLSLVIMSFNITTTFAAQPKVSYDSFEQTVYELVVDELISNQKISPNAEKVELVALYNELGASNGEQAIQVTTPTATGIQIDTIIPFVTDEEGRLVNSFSLANSLRAASSFPVDLADTTVTFTANYDSYTTVSGWKVYRQKLFSFSWDGSGDTVVTSIMGTYETQSVLYSSDIITNASSPVLDENYHFLKALSKTNPVAGTVYTNTVSMPTTRVVRFTDFWAHGTYLTYDIDYISDGESDNDTYTVTILSK